jgi:hypothetical protein
MAILITRLPYTGILKMGLVKIVWLWMGAIRPGWLMKWWFIIVSSRLVRNGFDLVGFG